MEISFASTIPKSVIVSRMEVHGSSLCSTQILNCVSKSLVSCWTESPTLAPQAKAWEDDMTLPCRFWFSFLSTAFCVIQHTLKINDDYGLISNNPSIMSRFEQRDIPNLEISFCSIIHFDSQGPRDMILEMGSLTTLCIYYRFDRGCPSPTRLECSPSYRSPPNVDDFQFSLIKRPYLIRFIKTFPFHFCHLNHLLSLLAHVSWVHPSIQNIISEGTSSSATDLRMLSPSRLPDKIVSVKL